MSHLKDIWNDFTRSEPLTGGAIRKQGRFFLIVGLGSFLWFLLQTILSVGEPIAFTNVIAKDIQLSSPVFVLINVGKYGYSEAHTLYYETTSFFDRLIFNSIGSFNIFDFLFFLYVAIVLFRVLHKVHEQNVFKLKVSNAYKVVGKGCILIWFLKMAFYSLILRKYFAYRTDGQFSLPRDSGLLSFFLYPVVGGIILSFVYFMNKGEDLQHDNDLTI